MEDDWLSSRRGLPGPLLCEVGGWGWAGLGSKERAGNICLSSDKTKPGNCLVRLVEMPQSVILTWHASYLAVQKCHKDFRRNRFITRFP